MFPLTSSSREKQEKKLRGNQVDRRWEEHAKNKRTFIEIVSNYLSNYFDAY
jgi:hypothetical protein